MSTNNAAGAPVKDIEQHSTIQHTYVGRETDRPSRTRDFEQSWTAPKDLRPHHKKDLKQYTTWKQNREGEFCLCEKCGTLFGFRQLQIHHIDHDRRNNKLPNIQIYCEECNEKEKAAWLATYYAQRATVPTLKKDRQNSTESVEQLENKRLFGLAPTFHKSKSYKHQVLVHLIRYFQENKTGTLRELVADVVYLTGCSYEKAEEYIVGYSESKFAPFKLYSEESGPQFVERRKGWNEEKYATEEYKAALRENKTTGEAHP